MNASRSPIAFSNVPSELQDEEGFVASVSALDELLKSMQPAGEVPRVQERERCARRRPAAARSERAVTSSLEQRRVARSPRWASPLRNSRRPRTRPRLGSASARRPRPRSRRANSSAPSGRDGGANATRAAWARSGSGRGTLRPCARPSGCRARTRATSATMRVAELERIRSPARASASPSSASGSIVGASASPR